MANREKDTRSAREAWKAGQDKRHSNDNSHDRSHQQDPSVNKEHQQWEDFQKSLREGQKQPHSKDQPSIRESSQKHTGQSESRHQTKPLDSQPRRDQPPDMGAPKGGVRQEGESHNLLPDNQESNFTASDTPEVLASTEEQLSSFADGDQNFARNDSSPAEPNQPSTLEFRQNGQSPELNQSIQSPELNQNIQSSEVNQSIALTDSSYDGGTSNANGYDGGYSDAGNSNTSGYDSSYDAGSSDTGGYDGGYSDAGSSDAGGYDGGYSDAGSYDASSSDAGGVPEEGGEAASRPG